MFFCLHPYLLRQRTLPAERHDKIGGQLLRAAIVAPHFAEQRSSGLVPTIPGAFTDRTGLWLDPGVEQPFNLR